MGDIFTGTIDGAMKAKFAASNVLGKVDCLNCWAKFYCSGGCNANNQAYCGDIMKPFKLSCELEKKRLECAIMIKAALAEEDIPYDGISCDSCAEDCEEGALCGAAT